MPDSSGVSSSNSATGSCDRLMRDLERSLLGVDSGNSLEVGLV